MNDYFEKEFLALERELRLLKTAAQRSSATIETISKTVPLSIPLTMNSAETNCSGEQFYIVRADSNSILNITLDWYNEDVMEAWRTARISRAARTEIIELPNGDTGVKVLVVGTNWSSDATDDLSRLRRGESVDVNVNLTIQSTNDFEVEAS